MSSLQIYHSLEKEKTVNLRILIRTEVSSILEKHFSYIEFSCFCLHKPSREANTNPLVLITPIHECLPRQALFLLKTGSQKNISSFSFTNTNTASFSRVKDQMQYSDLCPLGSAVFSEAAKSFPPFQAGRSPKHTGTSGKFPV